MTECEWISADELIDADWAEWEDDRSDGNESDSEGDAPTLNAMFADLELELARAGVDISNAVDNGDGSDLESLSWANSQQANRFHR